MFDYFLHGLPRPKKCCRQKKQNPNNETRAFKAILQNLKPETSPAPGNNNLSKYFTLLQTQS